MRQVPKPVFLIITQSPFCTDFMEDPTLETKKAPFVAAYRGRVGVPRRDVKGGLEG